MRQSGWGSIWRNISVVPPSSAPIYSKNHEPASESSRPVVTAAASSMPKPYFMFPMHSFAAPSHAFGLRTSRERGSTATSTRLRHNNAVP